MEHKIYAQRSELIPTYSNPGDAGMDFRANIGSSITLGPGERALIGTGVNIALQPGYELQIRPRSGLAAKHGITIVNSPGTIDSNYRGEIGVILLNTDRSKSFTIEQNDRIAQGVIAKHDTATFVVVDSPEALGETNRGTNGFGSSGTK